MIDADESIRGGTVETRAVSTKLFFINFILLIMDVLCIFLDSASEYEYRAIFKKKFCYFPKVIIYDLYFAFITGKRMIKCL